jgi:hypothetical protein
MRILIVDTCYPAFLGTHYVNHPGLDAQPYDAQWRSLMDQCFATSDSYSFHLESQGHSAHEFVVNCTPLQERWAYEHAVSPPPVRFRGDRRRADAILLAQAQWYAPDLCYVQNLEVLSDRTLRELSRRCPLVGHLSTEPPSHRRLRRFELIVTPMPPFVEKLTASGLACRYLPLAFDTRIAKRLGPRPPEPSRGAVFVGSLKRYRRWSSNRIVERAAKRVHVDFWGYGANQWPRSSPVRRNFHGQAWGLDMFRVLHDARITVNRHGDICGPFATNMRLFEATGMGSLLVTDAKINLTELFDVGQEVVAYDGEDELVEAITHYLDAPDEWQSIASAGQARTFADHSYDRRMRQFALLIQDVLHVPIA